MKPKQIKVLSEMVLEETIHKSKNLFHKTVGNFKSFFFGGYKKTTRPLSCNPFCCGRNQKYQQSDEFYDNFYDEWESTLDKVNKIDSAGSTEPTKEEDASSGSYLSPKKSKQELGPKQKKQMGSSHLRKREVKSSSLQNANGGSYTLEKRMKDFEMVDTGDVEQVLDVEEALHYYSRLKSPVYLDIVDKFFLDMYSDFSVPPESISSVNNSKRRSGSQLGSQRLGSIRY